MTSAPSRSISTSLACLASLALFVGATTSLWAQPQALVQIQATAQTKDPHPIAYFWEGENESIKEPVHYYTYYYTGTVNSDATVPVGEDVKRIAIPNTNWEANKGAIISILTSYYEEAFNVQRQQPQGNSVGFDENFNYVETQQPKQAGAFDPHAAAEWSFYYDQFVLWQFYCRRVLLNDREATSANSSREELQSIADRRSLTGIEGINVEDVLKAAKEIRDASTPTAPGAQPPAAADPNVPHAATAFDPEKDYADAHNNDIFRDEFVQMAEQLEGESTSSYTEMLARISLRADENERLADWQARKAGELQDFARAWNTVRSGDSMYLGDTFLLMTKQPVELTNGNGLNVVVRNRTTPQDILDPSGTIKKPTSSKSRLE